MKKPKSLGKQCDILWAKKVKDRAGWKCEYCGKDGPVAAHHIIPRTCHPLRHDMENGVSLCHPRHHLYWAQKDALGFAEWIETIRDMDREDGHDLEGARLVSIRMQAIAKQSLEEK